MYTLDFTPRALKDIELLGRKSPAFIKKLQQLLAELRTHPERGTGKPELLKHYAEPTWSRRISAEHRLVYRIKNQDVIVVIISVHGHYE